MEANHILHAEMTHPLKKKPFKSPVTFSQKEVYLSDTPLFFPRGLEKIFLAIYFITLPYITGILFLFFYIADGKMELFSSLDNESSFILTWAIGYEIIASLILLYIIKSAITFTYNNTHSRQTQFHRP